MKYLTKGVSHSPVPIRLKAGGGGRLRKSFTLSAINVSYPEGYCTEYSLMAVDTHGCFEKGIAPSNKKCREI